MFLTKKAWCLVSAAALFEFWLESFGEKPIFVLGGGHELMQGRITAG
jgi:hypothetical protein